MPTYNYVLPSDWVQIRLDPFERASVKTLVDSMFSSIQDEITRVRISGWVTSQLSTAMEGIAEQNAWAAYLPAEDPREAPLRPMIVTRPFEMPTGESDPMEVLVSIAAGSEGEVSAVEPRGMVGLKIRLPEDPEAALLDRLSLVPPDIVALTDEEELLATAAESTRLVRRVQYIIGDPENLDRWMMVEASASCTLAEGAQEALDGVEEFFDAWVGILSWVEEEEGDVDA